MEYLKTVEPLAPQNGRKGDGGTYLVVADDSDEFKIALRYGCFIARKNRAHVGILYVAEQEGVAEWNALESRIKKEQREIGEKYIWSVAKTAHDFNGTIPALYFAEGNKPDALIETINQDADIVQLILGGSADHNHHPLISYFLGKGMSRLRVPVVVVPGHIQDFS